jgi:hypothetical protein
MKTYAVLGSNARIVGVVEFSMCIQKEWSFKLLDEGMVLKVNQLIPMVQHLQGLTVYNVLNVLKRTK